MMPLAASPFGDWENFYVIVGSSAAALTGLQFVVIALIADSNAKAGGREIAAFGTPTVVHFCAALLVSAIVSAPWRSLVSPIFCIAAVGGGGVVYAIIVTRRARHTVNYRPVFEDWLWHSILPFCAYAAIVFASLVLRPHTDEALFIVGGAALLLLFIGIHNAWDTVTFVALKYGTGPEGGAEPAPPAATDGTPAPRA